MLKRLELIGFKSFADKTRFDFARGITAVVGPNGSGKSNVVDAVKWILGEQSAKSLRGGEMADVIFNGSSTRKSLGLAEVTMTFDNTKRQLQFDGDEVQITRRVYRDGQGEYLINQQQARLKDIKEMFLGSGAGHGAYSIIEQGRVDALLMASTKDRRQIFEEAAGISRFKAKKVEALRKLEATELNLNRVRDILQELEKLLRTLGSQAAKAQKYQDYQTRLKQLRVGLGLHEFTELADTLKYQEELLTRLRSELGESTSRIEAGESGVGKIDWDLARNDETLRVQEKKLGEARQQIAEQEATAKSQREQAANLDAELLRLGTQRSELARRLQAIQHEQQKAAADSQQAGADAAGEEHRAEAASSALAVVLATIAELTRQAQAARDEQFALIGRAAQHRSTADMTANQVERLNKELLRKKAEGERVTAEAAAIERVLADLSENNANLQGKLSAAKTAHDELRHRQAEHRHQVEALQPRLDELRDRRGDLRGRADVLEQLERSQEGLGLGVKAILDTTRNQNKAVLGLVADFLTVPHEIAPLIDIVLGDVSQRFVLREGANVESVINSLGELPGRVGFIPLSSLNSRVKSELASGTAIEAAVKVTSTVPGLIDQLLGRVLIVDTLAEAEQLHGTTHPLHRIISRRGELLEPDGTVIVGPLHGGTGILSRKSELRDLREQLAAIEAEVTKLDAQQSSHRHEADALDAPISGREAELAALSDQAGNLRDRIAGQREKQARLVDMVDLVSKEATILATELQRAESALKDTTAEAETAETAAAAMKGTLTATEQQLRLAESTREQRQTDNTAAQVALSKAKQLAATLSNRLRELDQELRQRTIEASSLNDAEASAKARLQTSQLSALRATAIAAEAYGEKERREQQAQELIAKRDELRTHRDRIQEEVKSIRDAWKQHQDQAHAHELTVRDLMNRRVGIEARIREDYAIELAEQSIAEDSPFRLPPFDEDEVQNEIDDLRKKITRLGSVNLEALEQLVTEEAREKALRTEFDDLNAAQKSLLSIIETINTDSRKLFAEMLDVVRVQFQDLFRKLFGGGMADIVLENPNDVLETGIEITARPPGKELRSISLLSGGEKTLTAVALLLAIFRSKPSPFCLLDEVDAALDEANTARLANVLREFLDQSQFIIITHKKRTMVMADVLYGITMQESGVSKQVATRIEDWPDDEGEQAAA
ncbi:chromosome segregation protein SMC [soil metagenome]